MGRYFGVAADKLTGRSIQLVLHTSYHQQHVAHIIPCTHHCKHATIMYLLSCTPYHAHLVTLGTQHIEIQQLRFLIAYLG